MHLLLWVAIALLAQAGPVLAQERPVLMLDSGGHMGLVADIAFTPDGKHLVAAGHDKVVRVWDWQAGRTVRTLRGRVGPGDEGKIYAVAVSPDGRRLAAAGQMTVPGDAKQRIRIYDLATGDLQQLLASHTGKIVALAFSPDGARLVSGSQDRTAILWDVAEARPLHSLDRHKAEVYAVGFTPDGERVVTGSFDRTLRLWRVADGRPIAEMKGHGDKVYALAVSPRDGSVASGSFDGEIRLWDGRTGRLLRPFANQAGALVGSLSFSPDGGWLLSTCGGGRSCLERPQIVWDVATGRHIQTYARHDNNVLAAAVSPDGRFVATAGGDHNEIHIWDARTGETRQVLRGTGAPVWSAAFAATGSRLAWGQTWTGHDPAAGYGPLQWQLRLPHDDLPLGRPERLPAGEDAAYLRARVQHGPYTLKHDKGGTYGLDAVLDIAKAGRRVARIERGPTDGYSHRSYGFSPDGSTILSGGSIGYLAAYDLRGRRQGAYVGHEGDVWAVAPSPDGRFLVSGAHDQTLRLWNRATRELIVTLFFDRDGEWVLWTPQGYYTGSPGADRMVGWQIDRGPDRAADYVGAEQLRQHLNRPDIVERAIVLVSAEAAVREAPGGTFRLADLLARPVPRFRILAPGTSPRGGRGAVTIAIDPTPDPVRSIRVQVNGRQVEELTPDIGSGGFGPGERSLDVPLAGGRNDVRIVLTNAIGESAETLTLTHAGQGALDRRGTLHILAIGVDRYPGLGRACGPSRREPCDLAYAGADARLLAEAVERRLGPEHTRVVKRVLVNGAEDGNDLPTAANILDAFARLRQATENDTVVASLSGHGINDGPNYRFLATNAEWDGPVGKVLRGSTIVPWQVLQEALETTKGRRILFADTCHAANAYNQRLGNAAYHANIVAYTAARFDQEALEDPRLGHGLFSYAVAEGLGNGGARPAKRQISTAELADYIVKRVDELAKALNSEQEPQYFKGRDAADYILARW